MLLFNSPTNDGRVVMVKGKPVRLDAIKSMQDELMDKIEAKMDRLLWGRFKLSDDIQIHDEPRELGPEYSFVGERCNTWNSEISVLEYILSTPERLAEFAYVGSDGHPVWLPGACMRHMKEIFELQQLLIIGIISSAGEPARGVEYACMIFANIPGGSIRNVFWLLGTLIFRGSYNKTSHFTGQDKTMVRVPLPRLAWLIVRFLVYLRPLFSEWQYHFHPKLYDNARTFFFAGLYRPVTAYDISVTFAKYTEDHLGVRFTIRTWRQYMAYVFSWYWRLTRVVHGTTYAHIQLGHSGGMDIDHYGGDRQLPEGFDRSLFMQTARVSAVLHIVFGHPPELLQMLAKGQSHITRLEHIISAIENPIIALRLDQPSDGAVTTLPDNQNAPTTGVASLNALESVAGMLYQSMAPEVEGCVKRTIARCHADLLEFLRTRASGVEKSLSGSLPAIYPSVYVLGQLRHFMNHHDDILGFKTPQQAVVTQLMYEGTQNILYVSPTGIYVCASFEYKYTHAFTCRIWQDTPWSTLCFVSG